MSDMSDTSDTHSDSYKTEIVFKVTVPGHDTAPVGVVEKDYINQLQDWSKIYFGQHKELSYNIDVVSNKMTAPPSGYDSEDEEIPGLIPFTQEEIDYINNPFTMFERIVYEDTPIKGFNFSKYNNKINKVRQITL